MLNPEELSKIVLITHQSQQNRKPLGEIKQTYFSNNTTLATTNNNKFFVYSSDADSPMDVDQPKKNSHFENVGNFFPDPRNEYKKLQQTMLQQQQNQMQQQQQFEQFQQQLLIQKEVLKQEQQLLLKQQQLMQQQAADDEAKEEELEVENIDASCYSGMC